MATLMTPGMFRHYAHYALHSAKFGHIYSAEQWLATARKLGASADACRDAMYLCRQVADRKHQARAFQRYAIAESVWRFRVGWTQDDPTVHPSKRTGVCPRCGGDGLVLVHAGNLYVAPEYDACDCAAGDEAYRRHLARCAALLPADLPTGPDREPLADDYSHVPF